MLPLSSRRRFPRSTQHVFLCTVAWCASAEMFCASVSWDRSLNWDRSLVRQTALQLTKDYTDSPLHRFRNGRQNKNLRHICPPSPVIHVSNLHASAS